MFKSSTTRTLPFFNTSIKGPANLNNFFVPSDSSLSKSNSI